MKVGFVSLGCSKNLVDTEKTIGVFKSNGYEIVVDSKEAEVIVINTCGFIEKAKEEAINTILEMSEYKKRKCKYLIVMGCLVERYKNELIKAIPEVDLFIKYSEYNTLWQQIENLLTGKKQIEDNKYSAFEDIKERIISTGNNYAYLKIADGCSNRCTYCAIPYIRGPQISRKKEDILEEANKLVKDGYQELILIAQDTTKYGIDIYGKPMISQLLKELCKIKDLHWIRFLYAYPENIDDELIKVVKENSKICKYFDIPIQHISDKVLKMMNRKSNGKSIRELIKKLRKEISNVVIRTTVMVGFPGETKDDFEELYDFLKETKFDKLGCFEYSREDGTSAARMEKQIHPMTKKSRYNKIMSLQQKISKENLQSQIGKNVEVFIEEKINNKIYIGRTYMDVPEIDGVAYLKTDKNIDIGHFTRAKIVDVDEYNMYVEDIEK